MNPFAVLGLAPTVLKGLSDSQIKTLVQSQYRVLSLIHHPDRGGKQKAFQAVTEAFEQLGRDETFQYHKQIFLKKRRDRLQSQVDELLSKNMLLAKGKRKLAERLCAFWSAFLDPQSAPTVFGLSNASMLVFESMQGVLRAKSVVKTPGRVPPAHEMVSACNLEVDAGGTITRYAVKRVRFDARKQQPPPEVPKEWISVSSNAWQSHYFARTGKKEVLGGMKIVASLSFSLMKNAEFSGKRVEIASLLPGPISVEDYNLVNNGFSWDQIRQFVPFFSPYVQSFDELIGVKKDDEGNLRFFLLGTVRTFARISR